MAASASNSDFVPVICRSTVAVRGGVLASARVGQNFSVLPSSSVDTDESEHGLIYSSTSIHYLLAYFYMRIHTQGPVSLVPSKFLLPCQTPRFPFTHPQQKTLLLVR